MATLSEAQAQQSAALTTAYKQRVNRDAARIAALVALYYQQRVNVEDPRSVEAWLELMIPRIISTSDTHAATAATFFQAIRDLETGRADGFRATAALGVVDPGVRKSLMAVGPGDYMNKMRQIERLDLSPARAKAAAAEAKQMTTEKLIAATVRHAQAGSRETIARNTERDGRVALGYVRVTREEPCFFCAMLASRGLSYRPFKEDSFATSDARYTGPGDAKVHDNCGCSLKPVYADNDPLVARTEGFAEMWSMWGAGGGNAALRFRRGYDHFRKTGDYLTWDEADAGL